jgi:hypothetical protein
METEARLTRLEAITETVQRDVADIKTDLRRIDTKIDAVTRDLSAKVDEIKDKIGEVKDSVSEVAKELAGLDGAIIRWIVGTAIGATLAACAFMKFFV